MALAECAFGLPGSAAGEAGRAWVGAAFDAGVRLGVAERFRRAVLPD